MRGGPSSSRLASSTAIDTTTTITVASALISG